VRQKRLLDSAREASILDENKIFDVILADKGLQDWILELNKEQLFDGENSLGVKLSDIGGDYSAFTLSLNPQRSIKKEPGKVTLYESGGFHNSFTLKVNNGDLTIGADPIKEDGTNLFDEWGDDVLGLQDDNLLKIISVIREKTIEEVRRRIAA